MATALVSECTLDKPGPNWQFDFLDFPTGWWLANRGVVHTTPRCSYVQTWGGSLCDCGAIEREWERLRASLHPGPTEILAQR